MILRGLLCCPVLIRFVGKLGRRTLNHLTLDGRIHPGRIEEMVTKCKKEVTQEIQKAGEQAIINVGIDNVTLKLSSFLVD
ncbi:MAG: hypothetical protein Ct9H300mP23_12380 [Nitrospinota bacterium]|nr:MAG: hypothetical protein Ct9H300mP23_12380 [Nitrospinota bacterium]